MQSHLATRGLQPIRHHCTFNPDLRATVAGLPTSGYFFHSTSCFPARRFISTSGVDGFRRWVDRTHHLSGLNKSALQSSQGSRRFATAAAARVAPAEAQDGGLQASAFIDKIDNHSRNSVEGRPSFSISEEASGEEKADLIELYNYAARFDCIPKVHYEFLGSKRRPIYRITIELEEQGIRAVHQQRTLVKAKNRAVLDFKKQADAHCRKDATTASIMSSTSLTTENAKEFLSFYRIKHRDVKTGVRWDELENRKLNGSLFCATPTLNEEPLSEPISNPSKTSALAAAELVSAIVLRKRAPHLWPKFVEELKKGSGKIIEPVRPVPFPIGRDSLISMRNTVRRMHQERLFSEEEPPEDNSAIQEYRQRPRPRMSPAYRAARSGQLKEEFDQLMKNPRMAEIRAKVQALPASQFREEILRMVNDNIFSIVVGATGSGKTTQIPQILFDNAIKEGHGASCNIITTQPRRIAATSVAERVAAERNRPIRDTVGYHVRFNCKAPALAGSITYCTTGILLAQLQHGADEVFDTVSHLVIDEVHERDMELDFLLITLKRTIAARLAAGKHVPKVVFMSATLDVNLFSNYFPNLSRDGKLIPCPHVSVPGRTFPVREHYLEDITATLRQNGYPPASLQRLYNENKTAKYLAAEEDFASQSLQLSDSRRGGQNKVKSVDWENLQDPLLDLEEESASSQQEDPQLPLGLAAATISHIAKTSSDGAILVFLPGYDGIKQLETILTMDHPLGVNFANERKFRIIKLHSSIAATQTEVFDTVPEGCRKIILSTNIAETSVTIPDIKYVVDTGKVNQQIHDPQRRVSKLACCWTSKSNCRQRAGRAGRVQDGNYYALFSKERFNSLRAVGVPDILRLDLQEVCLRVKAGFLGEDVREFLNEAIEAPSATQVDSSVINLQKLQALDGREDITALGRLLSKLPLAPSLGKMIVLGIVFRCLEPIVILSAASAERELFLRPLPESRNKAREVRLEMAGNSRSDHIAILNGFYALRRIWREKGSEAAHTYATQNLLSFVAFRNIQRSVEQIETILSDAGLIPNPGTNFRNYSPGRQVGGEELNEYSTQQPLIKAILLGALYPNIAVKNTPRVIGWQTELEAQAMIGQRSVNSAAHKLEPLPRGSVLAFSSLNQSGGDDMMSLVNTTLVTPLMVCLFGGNVGGRGRTLRMDSWLPFTFRAEEDVNDELAGRIVTEFRRTLDKILSHTYRDLEKFHPTRKPTSMGALAPGRKYLADDPLRTLFSEGLVEALSMSYGPNQSFGETQTSRMSRLPGRTRSVF